MKKLNLPRGIAKHIREGKARIRREFLDTAEQEERMLELYAKFGIAVTPNDKPKTPQNA